MYTSDMVTRVNFFKKGNCERRLFVGEIVDVAWLVVGKREFEPFKAEWRIYGEDGSEPTAGYNDIDIAPRPEGLLNVRPVLQ